MSYLQKIADCNHYQLDNALPFIIDDEQLGWIQNHFIEHLKKYPDVFVINKNSVEISPSYATPESRTEALRPVTGELHEQGVIDTWVGEDYPVVNVFEEQPRLLIERASTHYFGVRSFGVHINGLVLKDNQPWVWVARRSREKPFWPGKLDQLVAGGQPHGISLLDNIIKECQEEADIPASLARTVDSKGALNYCAEGKRGINPDTLFIYDLWLPESFEPVNTDGEVEAFELWPMERLAEETEHTDHFKDNCNLVNIDLLLRMGYIDPAHADCASISEQLYAPATSFSVNS